MPKKIYLMCSECNFFDFIKVKENINKDYNIDFNGIENILLHKGLPIEICNIIINLSNELSLKKCLTCKNPLCERHQEKAKNNAKCYKKKGLLCGQCSWYQYQV